MSRNAFRLRVATALALIFLVLAFLAIMAAISERVASNKAESRRLAAVSLNELRDGNLDTACILSSAAVDVSETEEAKGALSAAVNHDTRLIRLLHGHAHRITCLAFDPKGTRLASADDHGRIILWSVPDGRKLEELQIDAMEAGEVCVSFDVSGTRLAAANIDGVVAVWLLSDDENSLGGTSLSYESKWLLEGKDGSDSRNGIAIWFKWPELKIARLPPKPLRIYHLEDKSMEEKRIDMPETAHIYRRNLTGARLFFDRQGKTLVGPLSAHTDAPIPVGVLTMWDAESGKVRWAESDRSLEPDTIAVHPDLAWLAVVSVGPSSFGGASVFGTKATGGYKEQSLVFESSDRAAVFAPSANGDRLLSGHVNRVIRIWDVGIHTLGGSEELDESSCSPLNGHSRISALTAAPGDTHLASGAEHGIVYLWGNYLGTSGRENELKNLRKRASQIASRNLTQVEWLEFFPGRCYRRILDLLVE